MAQLTLTSSGTAQVFTEPLSVPEVEHVLRLPALSPEDEDRTALLESLIIAAREVAEGYQGRDLVEKQWDLTLPYFYSVIELRTPLVSVDLVQYTDSDGNVTALTENTDFLVDTAKEPGVIMPVYGGSWPSFTAWPTSPVLVRFTSGLGTTDIFWSDAGQRVLIGMKKLIELWYNEAPVITTGATAAQIPFGIAILLGTGAVPRPR